MVQTKKPMIGLEPITCWLQISCSANWATSACLRSAEYKSAALPTPDSFHSSVVLKWATSACLFLPSWFLSPNLVTPTGIEPVLPPWKGDVLTAWPRSRFLSFKKTYLVPLHLSKFSDSPSRTWTYDSAVNSRVLYRLSYRGKHSLLRKNCKKSFAFPKDTTRL